MEVDETHDLAPASSSPSKACGVIQSKSEVLTTRELMMQIPAQIEGLSTRSAKDRRRLMSQLK